MENNFLLQTTYDEHRGQVRINAFKLVRDFTTTTEAVASKHPSVRPFASFGLSQDDVDTLFAKMSVEHLILAKDFEGYFEVDGGFLSEELQDFLGSLEYYATLD